MTLKERLLAEFPGRMENEQAFIMQFIMMEAQKGNSPPSKNEIDSAINQLISDGIFEKKGALLILRSTDTNTAVRESQDEEEEVKPIFNPLDYPPEEQQILFAFGQAKYENKSALLMNITMKELQQGNQPPPKDKIEAAISSLVSKGVLELKGTMLIKKS